MTDYRLGNPAYAGVRRFGPEGLLVDPLGWGNSDAVGVSRLATSNTSAAQPGREEALFLPPDQAHHEGDP